MEDLAKRFVRSKGGAFSRRVALRGLPLEKDDNLQLGHDHTKANAVFGVWSCFLVSTGDA